MITWSLVLNTQPTATPQAEETTNIGYTEVALNIATGDIAIPVHLLRGAEAIIQRIRVRFRFVKGEWFLDQRLGVPYFQEVFKKNPDTRLITEIFRTVLRTTPGVKKVDSFTAALDSATRTLSCTFHATLTDGTVVLSDAEPFIIGT